MIRSVENTINNCFNDFQEKLLMNGYDVEFKNKDKVIEKISEPILDTIRSAFFSQVVVEISVKPEQDDLIIGKRVFGNSLDFVEDFYFRLDKNECYNLYNDGNYIEVDFVIYDYETYKDIFSDDEEEEKIPFGYIDELIDEHIETIKNILKAYEIEPEYDSIINAVTFKVPLEVEITRILV
jgi:hypothetical protein